MTLLEKTLPAPPLPQPPSVPPNRPRRRAWPVALTAVLLALTGVIVWRLVSGLPSGGRGNAQFVPPQAVGIATVSVADIPIIDSGLATITVQTQISGLLQSVNFSEGQLVHQGDMLAQIDPRPYEALLAQARGALARDQALLAQAVADDKRYGTLNKQDSISRQQSEDQHFLVLQDQGTVSVDQGTIQTQLVNLAFCRITAPVTGRVGLRQVDAGNYVTPSEPNGLVVETQLEPISVIFTLPEDDLPQIMQRLGAGVMLPVTVFDRENTAQLGTGVLKAVDTQIDTTTGTVKLRALFDNKANALFPSQFVNANLLVDTHTHVLTVPNAALQTGSPGTFVYVVKADDTVSVRPVKIGAADAVHTEITAGLGLGERVVIDGADRLREGAHVMVPTGTPAAPVRQHHHHWHE
jgi:multidrug efflux system membrane fusion protein